MNKGILKEAAETIRSLDKENKDFKQQQEVEKLASEILEKLIKRHEITLDSILDKKAELEATSLSELQVYTKALDLTKEQVKLGSLSEQSDGGETAQDRFISFLMSD